MYFYGLATLHNVLIIITVPFVHFAEAKGVHEEVCKGSEIPILAPLEATLC